MSMRFNGARSGPYWILSLLKLGPALTFNGQIMLDRAVEQFCSENTDHCPLGYHPIPGFLCSMMLVVKQTISLNLLPIYPFLFSHHYLTIAEYLVKISSIFSSPLLQVCWLTTCLLYVPISIGQGRKRTAR